MLAYPLLLVLRNQFYEQAFGATPKPLVFDAGGAIIFLIVVMTVFTFLMPQFMWFLGPIFVFLFGFLIVPLMIDVLISALVKVKHLPNPTDENKL